MHYTKFEGHWLAGFGEEIFEGFLRYMGMAASLVIWPGSFEQTGVPPSHWGSIWNLALISPAVSEEMFEKCGRWTDNVWQKMEPAYTIRSPISL